MKFIIVLLLLIIPPAYGQIAGVELIANPIGIYLCSEVDPTRCTLMTQDGTVHKRKPPVGRRAIDYDMQNWQWSKDQIMAGGGESWEQDALYWQVRLLADKAWARMAASPLPPAFVLKADPEHRDPLIERYRERYTQAAKLVLILEVYFGLPNNKPVGG